MNGALTDECELTTAEEQRKELSLHPYRPGVIYITATAPGSFSRGSSFFVQSQRNTASRHAHGYAPIHSTCW